MGRLQRKKSLRSKLRAKASLAEPGLGSCPCAVFVQDYSAGSFIPATFPGAVCAVVVEATRDRSFLFRRIEKRKKLSKSKKVQIIYKVKNLCFLYEKLRNRPLPRSIRGTAGNSPSQFVEGDVGGKGRRCVTAPAHPP